MRANPKFHPYQEWRGLYIFFEIGVLFFSAVGGNQMDMDKAPARSLEPSEEKSQIQFRYLLLPLF